MVLSNIRKRSGLLILVIGVAMLGFILTDLMNSGSSLFQKGQNVLLKLGDTEVMFTSFEKELEESLNVKFASSLGSVNVTQQQRTKERDFLWDQKIKELLLREKFYQSGILVGNTETWDLVSGEITGQQAQLFGYFFRDQTESGDWSPYDPAMIQSWIELGSDNPQWFRYVFFKNNTVRDRSFAKYYNAIKQGLYVTQNEAKSYYTEQTQAVSGKYIYISNEDLIEDEISDKEIKQYYKNNKLEFPNSPNREISYFIFNLNPSDQDKDDMLVEVSDLIKDRKILNRRTNLEEIDTGFQNTVLVENFINQHGDNKYEIIKLSKKELNEQNIQGNIIYPYIDKNRCKLGRVLEMTDDSVDVVYLEREIYASDQTLNEIYSKVYDLISDNKKIDDINIISNLSGTSPRTVSIQKMDESVPGLGPSRDMVRWAFSEETNLNEPNFFDLENKYVIAILTNVSDGETKKLSDVYDEIKSVLINKSASLKLLKSIENLNLSTMVEISKDFNVPIKSISNLRMNGDVFGAEGANSELVGEFFGLSKDQSPHLFISEKGVYVLKKDSDGSISYPSNWDRYQQIIATQRDKEVDLVLVDILKNDKEFVDNRFNFY